MARKRSQSKRRGEKKTPSVPLNFVDLLALLVAILTEWGSRPNGLTAAQVESMKKDQSDEKHADEILQNQYDEAHMKFREAEAARYKAFEKELKKLRLDVEGDADKTKRLDALKRAAKHKAPDAVADAQEKTSQADPKKADGASSAQGNAGQTK